MRLFVAVLLEEWVKDVLCEAQKELREACCHGSFPERDNLHLTLAFIGETQRLQAVRRALAAVEANEFELRLGGWGRFNRVGGDVCWVGAEKTPPLLEVFGRLKEELAKEGFQLEEREFKPHITLARQVALEDPASWQVLGSHAPAAHMRVSKLFLMRSERLRGRLSYTRIDFKRLGGGGPPAF